MTGPADQGDTAQGGTARGYTAGGDVAGDVIYGHLDADDAMRCAELEVILFPGDGPWSAAAFLSEISTRHNTCLAARVGERLIGYAVLAALGREGDREFEVHTIGVDPAHQGRGIGRTLLRRMLAVADAEAAPVVLDVRTDNVPARTLYGAHGFEVVGLRPRYYRPSRADAYLMVRPAVPGSDDGEDGRS